MRLRQPDRPSAAAPEFLHRVWDAFIRTYPSTAGEPPSSGTGVELIEPLTDRERDVLRGMAAGLKYEEIAAQLFISLNTVRSHVKAVYGKLNVNNRTQALAAARRLDLL
jgi:LuxR family maltose regulon positive regulatory protein